MALRWYIVHAYSNFEHRVKSALEERIERMGLQDKFGDILVPTGLRFLGGLELSSPGPAFGGLSGLTLTADGDRMIAVSDRGRWFTARLVERDDGRLVGAMPSSFSFSLT